MSPNEAIIFVCSAIAVYQIRKLIFLLRQERLRRRINGKQ
jgi:hypothetical protein